LYTRQVRDWPGLLRQGFVRKIQKWLSVTGKQNHVAFPPPHRDRGPSGKHLDRIHLRQLATL
jgi:hypothetical protein